MRKSLALSLLALLGLTLLVLAAGCGGDDEGGDAGAGEGAGAGDRVEVELVEQDGSGQSGTATLASTADGKTQVTLELSNPPDNPQPVHIHSGSCEDLGDVAHPLTNLEGGRSETTVDVPLEELQNGSFAVNAHESEENIQNYVACGDVSGASTGSTAGSGSGY